MKATANFNHEKWDEQTYSQINDNMKLTKASVQFNCTGQIEGTASVEYLMFYHHFDKNDPHQSSATYVALIQVKGILNGKIGSFVMEDHGTYGADGAKSILKIIAGSGTGELRGISGSGKYNANQSGCVCELDYELPNLKK